MLHPKHPNKLFISLPRCWMIIVLMILGFPAFGQDFSLLTDHALITIGTFQRLCNTNAFSAQLKILAHMPDIDRTNTVQIYQSPTQLKMQIKISEIASPDDPAREKFKQLGVDDVSVILDEDKLKEIFLFPGLKCFFETPASAQTISLIKMSHKNNFDHTALGAETVLGRSCLKLMLSKQNAKTQATEWQDEKTGMPVKVEISRGALVMTYLADSIDLSRPSQNEFEIPSDFKGYATLNDVLKEALHRIQSQGKN